MYKYVTKNPEKEKEIIRMIIIITHTPTWSYICKKYRYNI